MVVEVRLGGLAGARLRPGMQIGQPVADAPDAQADVGWAVAVVAELLQSAVTYAQEAGGGRFVDDGYRRGGRRVGEGGRKHNRNLSALDRAAG